MAGYKPTLLCAILVQRAVPVLEGDTAETLAARILVEEHVAYVEALRKLGTLRA
jgi:phosphoribosylglycinamide formyltransferase-1